MNTIDLQNKIKIVINSQDNRINDLQKKLFFYSSQFKKQKFTSKKYQLELEKYHYQILKCNNEIERTKIYKNRCKVYLEYLKSKNNIFLEKQMKYDYIKILQHEAISIIDFKIKELEQQQLIEKILGSKNNILIEKESLISKKNKLFNKFLNNDFEFEEENINSVHYLNYNVFDIIKASYKSKNKKAS